MERPTHPITAQKATTLSMLADYFDPTIISPLSSNATQAEIRTHIALRQRLETMPQSRLRNRVFRRMQMLERPTDTQVLLKRAFGFGILGVIAYVTGNEGLQTIQHLQQTNAALTDIQTAFHHLNILNVPSTAQEIINDLGNAKTNIGDAINHGAKTIVGAIGEATGFALRPWKAPRRRGYIGTLLP